MTEIRWQVRLKRDGTVLGVLHAPTLTAAQRAARVRYGWAGMLDVQSVVAVESQAREPKARREG